MFTISMCLISSEPRARRPKHVQSPDAPRSIRGKSLELSLLLRLKQLKDLQADRNCFSMPKPRLNALNLIYLGVLGPFPISEL
jgi:hypothetical protein